MSIRMVVIALAICMMWSCGGERVTQLQETETYGEVGQPLSKLAVQQDALHAVVMFTLSQDGTPVTGAAVEFARSISGRAADYTEFAGALVLTDENGQAELKLSGDNVTGYYQARAWKDEVHIGSWSSIPINAGYTVLLNLPIGGKARVTGSSALENIVEAEPKESIVFSDLDWSSAQVQNRIAQYIVEKGYGYPTAVISGASLPLFERLRRGDTHVTMEIWLPNQEEDWIEAQAAGEVILVGPSLGKDWQSAFVIPAYLQEQYPDLDSVDDLQRRPLQEPVCDRGDRRQSASDVLH